MGTAQCNLEWVLNITWQEQYMQARLHCQPQYQCLPTRKLANTLRL